MEIVGLLLASGRGTRFDATGQKNKLLETLPDGRAVVRASAENLCAILSRVVVIAPGDGLQIARALDGLPLEIVLNPRAALGMGTSIAAGVAASGQAQGWLVALGDMPFIEATTIEAIRDAVARDPAAIAAPVFGTERGHPVGFGHAHREVLAALEGDQGARALLFAHPPRLVPVLDSGILRDIDTPSDLHTRA